MINNKNTDILKVIAFLEILYPFVFFHKFGMTIQISIALITFFMNIIAIKYLLYKDWKSKMFRLFSWTVLNGISIFIILLLLGKPIKYKDHIIFDYSKFITIIFICVIYVSIIYVVRLIVPFLYKKLYILLRGTGKLGHTPTFDKDEKKNNDDIPQK